MDVQRGQELDLIHFSQRTSTDTKLAVTLSITDTDLIGVVVAETINYLTINYYY